MRKRLGATAALLAAVAAVAGLFPGPSKSAQGAQPTIGLIAPEGSGAGQLLLNGSRSAAASLGDQLAIADARDWATQVSTIKSLIAQHAAAIAVQQGLRVPPQPILSALAEARTAGIPTLSFEGRYPGSVWVSESSSAQFMRALADALATQMKQRGKFVIVSCRPTKGAALSHVVGTWLKQTKGYFQRRYPRMRRVGIVFGPTQGTIDLGPVLRRHPHLRGLDFLCPEDALYGPPQLIRAHKVGRVFSAGNGGLCPPLEVGYANGSYAHSVRVGAIQIVCARNPTKLGYLTVWAADHLARGHKLRPGTQEVGGPIGTAHYYRHHQELRLGQPLTITGANVDRFAAP